MTLNSPVIALAAVSAAVLSAAGAGAAEKSPQECYPVAATRQLIADRGLADPFASMQSASASSHGEPIGAKLCRENDDLVYEISLLRRDGRVVRIRVDAATGKPHPGHKER